MRELRATLLPPVASWDRWGGHRLRGVTPEISADHPAGFDFEYSYWLECDYCSRRVEIPAAAYLRQQRGDEPRYVCDCEAADITDMRLALRDLNDVDCHDEQVGQHLWYHSSTYQDWPSPTYRDVLTTQLQRSLLPAVDLEKVLEVNTSMALHLGTYAAAIENMLRRMADEDTAPQQYWLHQVQIRLTGTDLVPGVGDELSEWFGGVPLSKLRDLGGRAARYVNVHEALGSISLAIDAGVIVRVRTISLFPPASLLPATEAGERAVRQALAELETARQLIPDTTGLTTDQYFRTELALHLAQIRDPSISDEVIARTKEFAPKFEAWEQREHEVDTWFRTELLQTYLPAANPQLRECVSEAIPVGAQPNEFHPRLRELAGLIVAPQLVVERFATAVWRTLESVDPNASGISE